MAKTVAVKPAVKTPAVANSENVDALIDAVYQTKKHLHALERVVTIVKLQTSTDKRIIASLHRRCITNAR